MQLSKPVLIGLGGVLILGILLFIFDPFGMKKGPYDDFAKCLTQKNVKMYGAFWCSHCNNMKKQFGSSLQYVTYIECSNADYSMKEVCSTANINSYPTWDFGNGQRFEGEVEFTELSSKSGCPLPR